MKEKKYYLVPITAKGVKYNGTSLKDILEVVDHELWEMKEYIIGLKYDFTDLSKEEMIIHEETAKKIAEEIKGAFKLRGLPERIIVVDDGDTLYELATTLPITTFSEGFLEVFEITGEEVVEKFVEDADYSTKVTNLFNKFISKENVLEKKKK